MLINRGWVPKSWKTKADQAAAERQAAAAAREAAEKEAAAAAAAATAAAAPSRSWWGGSRRQQAAEGQGQGATHAGAKEQPAPQPPVTVVGVLQPDEQPNQFIPQNQPDADEFHYVQREALVGGAWAVHVTHAPCTPASHVALVSAETAHLLLDSNIGPWP